MAQTSLKKVLSFAEQHGYADIEPLGDWNGFTLYEPVYSEDTDEPAIIGLPLLILVKGGTVRLSTPDEAFAYIDGLPE